MRYTHPLPVLSFDAGAVVFSPGIISALTTASEFRQVIDHFLECHVATDFGVISRAARFDNALAALLGTGQLTSRYFIPRAVLPVESVLIITTHLDAGTTIIRFSSEQE